MEQRLCLSHLQNCWGSWRHVSHTSKSPCIVLDLGQRQSLWPAHLLLLGDRSSLHKSGGRPCDLNHCSRKYLRIRGDVFPRASERRVDSLSFGR